MPVEALSLRLPNLRAVFFDLDDTLVFSESAHTKAWYLSLPQFGINPKEIDFTSMVGMSDMRQAALFKALFKIKETAESICEMKRNNFLELIKQGLDSPLGRNAFLESLSKKYVIGIVSSSPQRVIKDVLHLEKIADFFHFIVGHEDCTRHKPDPLPYQNALTSAKVAPHEALVIEDSVTGITSAMNASIPVI